MIADIIVHGRDGNLQLVVEIKNKLDATPEWASRFRRNLLVHAMLPDAPFFLLALPDAFYFWKSAGPISQSAPPDFWSPVASFFAAHPEKALSSLEGISEQGLHLLVASWLEELIHSNESVPFGTETQWLVESGLISAIQGGSVRDEVLV